MILLHKQTKIIKMSKQLKLFKEEELPVWVNGVPFVDEVETFNATFGKPNNYEPTIPEEKEWKFWECYWIEQFKQWNFEVVNIRKKGGGGVEFCSEQHKNKIGKANSGKKQSKEALQNRLIELYKSVLTHPKVIKDVMKPLDNDILKDDINNLKPLCSESC